MIDYDKTLKQALTEPPAISLVVELLIGSGKSCIIPPQTIRGLEEAIFRLGCQNGHYTKIGFKILVVRLLRQVHNLARGLGPFHSISVIPQILTFLYSIDLLELEIVQHTVHSAVDDLGTGFSENP